MWGSRDRQNGERRRTGEGRVKRKKRQSVCVGTEETNYKRNEGMRRVRVVTGLQCTLTSLFSLLKGFSVWTQPSDRTSVSLSIRETGSSVSSLSFSGVNSKYWCSVSLLKYWLSLMNSSQALWSDTGYGLQIKDAFTLMTVKQLHHESPDKHRVWQLKLRKHTIKSSDFQIQPPRNCSIYILYSPLFSLMLIWVNMISSQLELEK